MIANQGLLDHLARCKEKTEAKETARKSRNIFVKNFVGPRKQVTLLQHLKKCAREVADWPEWKKAL